MTSIDTPQSPQTRPTVVPQHHPSREPRARNPQRLPKSKAFLDLTVIVQNCYCGCNHGRTHWRTAELAATTAPAALAPKLSQTPTFHNSGVRATTARVAVAIVVVDCAVAPQVAVAADAVRVVIVVILTIRLWLRGGAQRIDILTAQCNRTAQRAMCATAHEAPAVLLVIQESSSMQCGVAVFMAVNDFRPWVG